MIRLPAFAGFGEMLMHCGKMQNSADLTSRVRARISPHGCGGRLVVSLIGWAMSEHLQMQHAHPSGVMPKQVHPRTHAPLSVSPLTWSRAFFVATVQDWAEKLRVLQVQE